ncbi:MAG: pilus assembly protein [Chloroflexi bacterium]|nr:pilus assembly protein [Chloroflexota bacterium]
MRGIVEDRGQALIEFAMVLPVIVLLLVGIFDVGRAIQQESSLTAATREATRYATVHGAQSSSPTGPNSATYTAPSTDTAVNAVVQRFVTGINTALTISSTWPDGNANRGSRVVVTATTPFQPLLSSFFGAGGLTITLRGSSTLAIEQ